MIIIIIVSFIHIQKPSRAKRNPPLGAPSAPLGIRGPIGHRSSPGRYPKRPAAQGIADRYPGHSTRRHSDGGASARKPGPLGQAPRRHLLAALLLVGLAPSAKPRGASICRPIGSWARGPLTQRQQSTGPQVNADARVGAPSVQDASTVPPFCFIGEGKGPSDATTAAHRPNRWTADARTGAPSSRLSKPRPSWVGPNRRRRGK